MLPRVIEIDDLHVAREVQTGKIPDPFGVVAQDNFLCRALAAVPTGFCPCCATVSPCP